MAKLQELGAANRRRWRKLSDWLPAIQAVCGNPPGKGWTWCRNRRCKYVTVRIDTRDGAAIIFDRDDNEISIPQLLWQYSKETPEAPSLTSTAS